MTIHSAITFLRARLQHVLNFGSFFVTRFLSLGLFAGSASYYINHAGAPAYGTLTLLLLVFSYLHIFDMGMGYAVNVRFSRRLARGHRNAEDVIRKALPFYMVATFIICAALFSGASLVSQLIFRTSDHTLDIRWLSLAVLFLMPSALCTAILQAYNRVYLINMSRVLLDVVRAGAMFAAAALGRDLTFIVLFMAGGSFLKLLIDISLTTYVTKSYSWFRPKFSWQDLRLNAVFGYPIMISTMVGMAFNSIDKLFVSRHFPEYLPFYSVAFDINTKAYFLIWAVNGTIFNVFVRRHAKNQSNVKLLKTALFGAMVITLTYYVPLFIFGENIIRLWINPQFAKDSLNFVRLMTVPSVLYVWTSVLYGFLQALGKSRLIFISDVCCFLVMLSSIFLFSKYFNIYSVFISFSLSFVVQLSFLTYHVLRIIKRTM